MTKRASLPKAVTILTPLRISFVGGGTDVPEHYQKHGGAVISSTIDKFIQVTVKRQSHLFDELYRISYSKTERTSSLDEIENDIARECLKLVPVEPPLYVGTIADLPASSGLGSSSSFAVGMLHALHAMRGERVSPVQLAEEACTVELEVLKNPIGKQDQYAAAFGGLNHIKFRKDGRVDIDHMSIGQDTIHSIFGNSVLLWTGVQRSASSILEKQIKNADKNVAALLAIKNSITDFKSLLLGPSPIPLQYLGKLLSDTWSLKKQLDENVTSESIDQLYESLTEAGGYGGKLCGAGGGGFVFQVVDPEKIDLISETFGRKKIVRIQHEPFGSRLISEIY